MSSSVEAGPRTRPLQRNGAGLAMVCGMLIALCGAMTAFVIYLIYERFWVDLEAYRAGGSAALQHISIYDLIINDRGLFTYAPFAAILFMPIALLSMELSVALWTLISILALEAVIWIILGLTTKKRAGRRAAQTILVTIIILPLFPVTLTLWNGQIGIVLLLLIIADLTHGKEKWRGIGTGIAAGIKLTPLIFIPYLLITRRFRTAMVTSVGFLATVALGFLLLPTDSRDYWGGAFIDSERVAPLPDMHILNHSLRGMLMVLPGHWHAAPVWFALAAIIGAGGLIVAAWAARTMGELAGITACAIVGLLVSPVSWSHHWVWCIPLLVLWARRARRLDSTFEKVGVGFLWLIFFLPGYLVLLTVLKYPTHAGAWLHLLADSYVFIGLAVLIAFAGYRWRQRTEVKSNASID
jgi:alpha-1,2-mannosyltransferase